MGLVKPIARVLQLASFLCDLMLRRVAPADRRACAQGHGSCSSTEATIASPFFISMDAHQSGDHCVPFFFFSFLVLCSPLRPFPKHFNMPVSVYCKSGTHPVVVSQQQQARARMGQCKSTRPLASPPVSFIPPVFEYPSPLSLSANSKMTPLLQVKLSHALVGHDMEP